MRELPFVALTALFALAANAQQQWVALHELGTAGVVVAGSPLPPRVIGQGTSPAVFQWSGSAFQPRTEPAPGAADLAAYDPVRARIVVYSVWGNFLAGLMMSSMAEFDGARWQTLTTNPMPPSRVDAAFAFDPVRRTMLLFGGLTFVIPPTTLNDTWELSGSTWTRLFPASPPSPRTGARLAHDAVSGGMLLFGGSVGSTSSSETWRWQGLGWTLLSPANRPGPRSGHAMATHPGTGRGPRYGGSDGATVLNDAWLWNGSDWSAIPAPPTPALTAPGLAADGNDLLLIGSTGQAPGVIQAARWNGTWTLVYRSAPADDRFLPGLALDTLRNEIVRFGGRELIVGAGAYQNDTWTWNGSWTRRNPATSPPPRSYSSMAFDPLRGQVVLFGGFDGTNHLGDTWLWNGTNWQQAQPGPTPPPRQLHSLAFDPTRGTVVLFGGHDSVTSYNDTWEWHGSGWSPVPTTTQPPPLNGLLAFDAARQVLVLYVDRANVLPSELWELRPAGWVRISNTALGYGRPVFDPATGLLALFVNNGNNGRYDYVGGTWVATGQPSLNYYLSDPGRGAVLGIAGLVYQSTNGAARTVAAGTGCGPLGTTTLAFDQRPRLGAAVNAEVRALAPGVATWLLIGLQPANAPLGGGCSAYLSAFSVALPGAADAAGWARIATPVPAVAGLIGFELWTQAACFHPTGIGLSNSANLRLGL